MKKLVIPIVLAVLALFVSACSSSGATDSGKVIKTADVGNNLTMTLSSKEGVLKNGDNDFFVSFKDGSGKAVDAGAVGLSFHMPAMGTMPGMNSAAAFTSTGSQGVYHGKVKLESAGDWQAQISYEGAAGKGKSSFTATAQ